MIYLYFGHACDTLVFLQSLVPAQQQIVMECYNYFSKSSKHNIIIIIMVIFKCYFSREHIALSLYQTVLGVLITCIFKVSSNS